MGQVSGRALDILDSLRIVVEQLGRPLLLRGLWISGCMLLAFGTTHAGDRRYDADVSTWKREVRPRERKTAAYKLWFRAGNSSELEWWVFRQDGKVRARLSNEPPNEAGESPRFTPKAGRFRNASALARVNDGWLVGFNEGEFGGALYWFSRDGNASYMISQHQVVAFFCWADSVHAIEGLEHLGLSHGSVIRIDRQRAEERWRATVLVDLASAPHAVTPHQDGTILITVSDGIVAVGPDRTVSRLLANRELGAFLPTSSALTVDGQRLYIGMRQFVGEFSLTTKRFRYLIPARRFLNQLPRDVEHRIRKLYRE